MGCIIRSYRHGPNEVLHISNLHCTREYIIPEPTDQSQGLDDMMTLNVETCPESSAEV